MHFEETADSDTVSTYQVSSVQLICKRGGKVFKKRTTCGNVELPKSHKFRLKR